ncbi:exo-beta-1,3-glucanase [Pisolithus marmoratus]|nr:exo-beta-1,3-glucanase [Pisolithus marmoratus]
MADLDPVDTVTPQVVVHPSPSLPAMAPNNANSPNIPYEPLPLSEFPRSSVFQESSSPQPSGLDTPPLDRTSYAGDSIINAPSPRFLAAALYQGDEHLGSGAPSAPASSVYALNVHSGQPLHDDDPDSEQGPGTDSPLYLTEKRAEYAAPATKSKRKLLIAGAALAAVIVAVAVIVPVYFTVVKPKSDAAASSTTTPNPASPSSTSGTGSPSAVTGGNGSKVTTEDGTTFIYTNPFGGFWYWDPNDPFNNDAQAQSWTPPLNQTFQFGIDKIFGFVLSVVLFRPLNLRVPALIWVAGSLLNLAPALYEKYQNTTPQAVDEWTLSEAMAADTANGGLSQLETHYKTFITEQDFAEIAGAGLNFVRIPLPYWAIETREGEPFLPKTAWTYFLKAIQWARKYGLRINLDFHALPGSQNGWNHSGKLGSINVLNGPMGYANAQRSLDYIRILAEFISQPEYRDVDPLSRLLINTYVEPRELVKEMVHSSPSTTGFLGLNQWAGFLPNADRTALDEHPYLCFTTQSSAPMSSYAQTPCDSWSASFNTSMSAFGMTTAGEWSNAVTDCGLWVNGVGLGSRYEGTYTGSWPVIGSCTPWTDWQSWNASMKQDITNFALASMDSLQNWFFWTWKIGNSSTTGVVEAPQWSYQLGLQNGWMPKDPRVASGTCANQNLWSPPLQAWQTGGAGAGQIPASVSSEYAWPPATISNAGAITLLPSYTPTGTVATLPPPTFTLTSGKSVQTASAGNGWNNPSDTAGEMVGIATCSYLDPWIGPSASPPSPLCSSGAAARAVLQPPVTPFP